MQIIAIAVMNKSMAFEDPELLGWKKEA